jgi:hypothetical protein
MSEIAAIPAVLTPLVGIFSDEVELKRTLGNEVTSFFNDSFIRFRSEFASAIEKIEWNKEEGEGMRRSISVKRKKC